MNALQRALDPLSGPVRARNRRRNPIWRFRRFFFGLVLLAFIGAGGVLYAFAQTELPEDTFDDIAQTSFLCTAEVTVECGPENAAAILSAAGEDREVITFEDLPESLIHAIVATEDQDFWVHQGIDPRGIARAAYQYLRKEGFTQGGSTITQQYVKLAFNDAEFNLSRKGREAIRAVKLEQELAAECSQRPDLGDVTPEECAKQEILTRYLNRAYFGRGASGVQAASRAYFGHDISELTIAESAYMASLLRNPNNADPERDLDEANRRRTTSLQLMLEAGYIDAETATAANTEDWEVVPRRDREGLGEVKGAEWGSEYFVEEVRLQLDDIFQNGEIYTDGLRVYTTLDLGLQRAAYETVHSPKPDEDLTARDLPELGPLYLDPNNPDDPAAAIVSIDGGGRVVTMLGGSNFDDSEFNLATSRGGIGRQPGSTFKVFGLALAIEQQISARSFYPAIPGVTRVGGVCSDADGPWQVTGGSSARSRYRDLVDALTWSSNVVFAQLVVDIGPDQLRDFAVELGVTTLPEPGELVPCATILGSQEVPVIEMASAFSVFERDGVRIDPIMIDRIEDVDGNVICREPTKTDLGYRCLGDNEIERQRVEVLSVENARQTNYAMSQVVAGGTGRRAQLGEEHLVVGKTGTSQNNRDGWFAGFTCDLTTVVWVGYDGAEERRMVDFRKPLPEDGSGPELDADGWPVDDRNWPNIEGGNFPTMLWADYMAKATANAPACTELNVSSDFTGTRFNQDLSTTTLPPCGVELDQHGFPRGTGPDDFVYLTTTAPPATQPAQPGNSQPEGLPRQDAEGDNAPPAPCIPPDQWIYQANPDAPRPTDTASTTPDGSTTVPDGSTTQTQGEQTTSTTAASSTTPTTPASVPSTEDTTPSSEVEESSDSDG